MISNNARVLVVAPHPDDETLGCGGTLLRYRAEGRPVHWLIMTDVLTAFGWSSERVALREREIERVREAYQFEEVHRLGFPTTTLDQQPLGELVGRVAAIVKKTRPAEVLIPGCSDTHSDHRVTFGAATSALKSFRVPFVQTLLMYEVLSETEFGLPATSNPFAPNVFVDISPYMEEKLRIFSIFESEVMEQPGPRSLAAIKSLATLRGSRAALQFAEAYQALFIRCGSDGEAGIQ